ncbi:DUF423 domain-containing protein [Psychromonas sp. MB-3u-54]|uniref:DUF423 domain-containing protein n=1 Tax=Psychromonas sp. MB-3u-54 TaxID=2058319 RepID=UPI000C31CF43|nr:DUF423 domain-containing protein [Psychromonas sp. MB-3u-54]PKH03811.1 DUF423 domain-containing protein [Psychromonas sp. MB-3u-54]
MPIKLTGTTRLFLIIASLLGASGVALGAYASHGLAAWATLKEIEYFQLAVTYQLFHAVTLLGVCLLSLFITNAFLLASKIAFVLGVVLFSGSLYLYVLTGTKILGAITPIGGLCLIVAWLLITLSLLSHRNNAK